MCLHIHQSDPSVTSSQETPAPGTSEAKQWEEDWDDAGWDDEDQDTLYLLTSPDDIPLMQSVDVLHVQDYIGMCTNVCLYV